MSINDILREAAERHDRHRSALPNPYLQATPDQNGAIESVTSVMHHLLKFLERHQEIRAMADYTRLMNDIADLSSKVDVLVEKANNPPPPADEQPAVDQAAAAVEAIIAKIPA